MKRPRWQIIQEFGSFYRRMPPKPGVAEKKAERQPWNPLPTKYYGQQPTDYLSTERDGNLENYEYEFFSGVDSSTASYSTCRWCKKGFHSKEERMAHMIEGRKSPESCATKLRKCYSTLKTRMKCLGCQGHTNKTHYGVPLCSIRCKNRFKFDYMCGSYLDDFRKGTDAKIHQTRAWRYPENLSC